MKAKAHCGSCGEAWFGDVAYCPYCGRPASARVPQASAELASALRAGPGHEPELVPFASVAADRSTHAFAGAEQPGRGRKSWAKPLALAAVFALLALAVSELAVPTRDKTGPQGAIRAPAGDAARSGTFELGTGVAASTPAVPRAELEPRSQPRPPVPPARNRSLCSAANEAAGLCNPQ